MKLFTYKAKDDTGHIYKDRIQVENKRDFFNYLQQKQIYCFAYRESHLFETIKKYRMSIKQLTLFCRQLALMLESELSLIKCIFILYQQEKDPKLKNTLFCIYEDLQKGKAFSKSLALQKGVFPDLLIGMVKCGEESGTLALVLERMAKHYESENKLQNKMKNAMVYPSILGIVSCLVILILLFLVVPTFVGMFEEYGQLPLSTQILMRISQGIKQYWGLILVILLCLLVSLRLLFQVKNFKQYVGRLKLRLPIIGKLNLIIISARLAETTATLYASGISLISILETVQEVIKNRYVQIKLDDVKQEVMKGTAFSNAIKQVNIFPPMLSHVILIGEESGNLEQALYKAAAFYHEEAEAAIQKMVALLEPCMITILGLIVFAIIGAVLPPMYQMMGSIG